MNKGSNRTNTSQKICSHVCGSANRTPTTLGAGISKLSDPLEYDTEVPSRSDSLLKLEDKGPGVTLNAYLRYPKGCTNLKAPKDSLILKNLDIRCRRSAFPSKENHHAFVIAPNTTQVTAPSNVPSCITVYLHKARLLFSPILHRFRRCTGHNSRVESRVELLGGGSNLFNDRSCLIISTIKNPAISPPSDSFQRESPGLNILRRSLGLNTVKKVE